jgi:hypothetical protein
MPMLPLRDAFERVEANLKPNYYHALDSPGVLLQGGFGLL